MDLPECVMMKRLLIILLLTMGISNVCSSQIVINSHFKPLSYEELYISAMAEAEYNRQQKERFERYQEKAYECYNRHDWNGFLTYSNYALDCGWYNAKLYYDRGVVYEMLYDFKHAKKEYKRAKKKGYAYAEGALRFLKIKEKEYKRRQKQNR